ncbi:hypothetical protein BGZ76_011312, partial [Entomortierella beljakovae]
MVQAQEIAHTKMKTPSLSSKNLSDSLLRSNIKGTDIWNEALKETFDILWLQANADAAVSSSAGATFSASPSSTSQSFSFASTNISAVTGLGTSTPWNSRPGGSDDDDDGGDGDGDGGGDNVDGGHRTCTLTLKQITRMRSTNYSTFTIQLENVQLDITKVVEEMSILEGCEG